MKIIKKFYYLVLLIPLMYAFSIHSSEIAYRGGGGGFHGGGGFDSRGFDNRNNQDWNRTDMNRDLYQRGYQEGMDTGEDYDQAIDVQPTFQSSDQDQLFNSYLQQQGLQQ